MKGRSGSQRQRRSVAGIAVKNLALKCFLHIVGGDGGGKDSARPQKNLRVDKPAGAVIPDLEFSAGCAGWNECQNPVTAIQNGQLPDCAELCMNPVEGITDRTQSGD
jgi:hypothetical protein